MDAVIYGNSVKLEFISGNKIDKLSCRESFDHTSKIIFIDGSLSFRLSLQFPSTPKSEIIIRFTVNASAILQGIQLRPLFFQHLFLIVRSLET